MYKIQALKMANDPETMMNIVNNDPIHIERAKAKAERHQAQKEIDLNTMLCGVVNKEVRKATANVMQCEHLPFTDNSKTCETFSYAAQWACLAVIGSFVMTVAAMLSMV